MPRKILCTIPERVCSTDRILAAEDVLRAAYREHFGADGSLVVVWCPLPDGQSYVAGSKDDVYLVMFEVAGGFDQSAREAAMMDFTGRVAELFQIDFAKPLVTALDSSKIDEYLAANRNRLRPSRRPGFVVATLWHALRSRSRDGFATLRANL